MPATTWLALSARYARSGTYVVVVQLRRLRVLWVRTKAKLVKPVVLAAELDPPQLRLALRQAVIVPVLQAITCLGLLAWFAALVTHALEVLKLQALVL